MNTDNWRQINSSVPDDFTLKEAWFTKHPVYKFYRFDMSVT